MHIPGDEVAGADVFISTPTTLLQGCGLYMGSSAVASAVFRLQVRRAPRTGWDAQFCACVRYTHTRIGVSVLRVRIFQGRCLESARWEVY